MPVTPEAPGWRTRLVVVCAFLLSALSLSASDAVIERQYSELREPCAEVAPLKRPFFGDLHVHTRYSLDASTQGTRTTPAQAYGFAQGESVGIQPWSKEGEPLRSLQLARPLDFAMISDHAELIGEVHMCNTPGVEGHDSWECLLYRHWPRGAYYLFNATASLRAAHLGLCGEDDELCKKASLVPWEDTLRAAERYYDRSADCSFTTFVGYEWTGLQPSSGGNLHRNVVFRNGTVPDLPLSYIDAPSARQLWDGLESACNGLDNACEALVIPHNSNMSAGYMFNELEDDGTPMGVEYARLRARYEPLVEIMQHKGASECYFKSGVTRDELCAFESLSQDNIAGFDNPPQPDTGFVRPALTAGLALQQRLDVNPYHFGVIASTDTHLGTPGASREEAFLGHGGAGTPAGDSVPPGLPDNVEFNPGGLAVVWARENSRDALFDAMLRRETYATSGPRIVSRFFGGWDFPAQMCDSPDRMQLGYDEGVPMGSDLPPVGEGERPTFMIAASQETRAQDVPGTLLQRIQIVKGWTDEAGGRHEAVYEVAGNAQNGAAVNTATCETSGPGYNALCSVWTDREFDPSRPAYYYSRVLENPSCRWSQRMCNNAGVDCTRPETISEGYEPCCETTHRAVVQERAWSSPIWYRPGT